MWPDVLSYGDYAFKSSPESCSDNSLCTDIMDVSSGEDFITQLSADLDIPLLLNPGEDELAVLSSFFDKSPDEILSEIASVPREDLSNDGIDLKGMNFCDWDLEMKMEKESDESSLSSNSPEPRHTPPPAIKKNLTYKVKEDPVKTTKVQLFTQGNTPPKLPIKRVPIQPKTTCSVPVTTSNNIVVIKNEFPTVVPSGVPAGVVVLDTIPVNNFQNSISVPLSNQIPVTSLINSRCNSISIDPKVLKRQQRKIKNRESACLSRKKKKDYITSLEEKVKELNEENKKLVQENKCLKDRLAFYEEQKPFKNISINGRKPTLVLCVFLLVIGLNLEFLSNPSLFKQNKADLSENNLAQMPITHRGRGLLWTDDQDQASNTTYFSPLTMCPASINQTESARLLLELERWIGKPEVPPKPPVATTPKPKLKRKKIRIDSSLVQVLENRLYGPENESSNEIQVFSPKPEQLYSEFFEAINRQDDTFYVVSFSEQHLLVPALYHNKTRRPKMTLLMPSVLPNSTSTQAFVPLMQIDCEVLDTKLVNVKYGAIPRQYRNITKSDEPHENKPSNTSGRNYRTKPYKPLFNTKGKK
ncbi:hypothetical protein GWI33_016596 [Rhynchophorus ferrugineus]|uniref:BZIP domain-containing protein n=1 Tax=Rhynchophorus ferrugineus TaxID=354439 RepID=A0A834M358_RHYFE|nr:hypothetical protein GWI33_016596 [Rhynchophorus ferrugineus]